MRVVIELPGIKAISRNETTGHFINYQRELIKAEQWMKTFGKRFEHHFEGRVDVLIEAYYDTRLIEVMIKKGARTGKKTNAWQHAADTPNIDDKIFTDTLNRYKMVKVHGKIMRIERSPWFIEDDKPKYLRFVHKESVLSDHYKVVITITEIEE